MSEKKILIVEDEGMIALGMKEILEEWGYTVCGIADSGERALKLAELERPDLALMDIRLAGVMDGIETAIRLRSSVRMPVVFMSGYIDEGTIARLKGIDMAGVLSKPVNFDALQELLGKLLKAPRRA